MSARRTILLWICLLLLISSVLGCLYIAYRERWANKLWAARPQIQLTPVGYYRITEVYDGDTFSVDMNGTSEKIRLIGVDTPETHKPNTPIQCYGPEASAYTKSIATGENVRLEADPTNSNRDRYDRLLRYAYLENGEFINKSLIEKGYGFAYTLFTFSKKDEFLAAEESAKSAGAGLWSACQQTLVNGAYQTQFHP